MEPYQTSGIKDPECQDSFAQIDHHHPHHHQDMDSIWAVYHVIFWHIFRRVQFRIRTSDETEG
jgi:hypothetical protein